MYPVWNWVGLALVTAQIVARCIEAREGLVLESTRYVEGRRYGSGEGPHQVDVAAVGKRA